MNLPEGVRRAGGGSGLERLVVETELASAEVHLQGGTVTGFSPAGAAPVLWLSPASHFSVGKAIRGGVPLCFPWFGPKAGEPQAPQHGLVRTAVWELVDARRQPQAIELTLGLGSTEKTREHFPFGFDLRLVVSIGRSLEVSLVTTALDALTFEAALHTYLHVGDVRRAEVRGLEGAPYVDKMAGGAGRSGEAGPLVLAGPTDRVYEGAPGPVEVTDPVLGRRLRVEKEGAASTVLWNPWADKARTMQDMGGEAWSQMLCVEAANVLGDAVKLRAGETHRLTTRLSVAP